MRTRTMVSVAVSACAALLACACGPGESKEDDAKPSQPSASTWAKEPSATPTVVQPAPRTKERAIQRYEQYLHALGREDIGTVCEVAGPGTKKAEDKGGTVPARRRMPLCSR